MKSFRLFSTNMRANVSAAAFLAGAVLLAVSGMPPVGIALIVAGLGAYFLPCIVAASREVPNQGSIAVINVFLGWTLIGWVVALAMAARSRPSSLTP